MLIIHLSSFCIQIPNKLNCNVVVNLQTEVNLKSINRKKTRAVINSASYALYVLYNMS